MCNPFNGDHLYTTDEAEYQALCDAGWNGEDVKMWGAPDGLPVYRLYNPTQLDNDGAYAHLWTADETEYNYLAAIGWLQEGPRLARHRLATNQLGHLSVTCPVWDT